MSLYKCELLSKGPEDEKSPAPTHAYTSEVAIFRGWLQSGYGMMLCLVSNKSGAEVLRHKYFVEGDKARGKYVIFQGQRFLELPHQSPLRSPALS